MFVVESRATGDEILCFETEWRFEPSCSVFMPLRELFLMVLRPRDMLVAFYRGR